jgi:hypothetical protein
VAVVLAEPGVGKTRLLEPTRGLTEEAGPRVFVHPELEAAPTGRGCRELRRPGRPLLAGGRTWPITSRWRCWWTTPIGRMQHRCGLSAVWPTRSRGCPWLWWWRPKRRAGCVEDRLLGLERSAAPASWSLLTLSARSVGRRVRERLGAEMAAPAAGRGRAVRGAAPDAALTVYAAGPVPQRPDAVVRRLAGPRSTDRKRDLLTSVASPSAAAASSARRDRRPMRRRTSDAVDHRYRRASRRSTPRRRATCARSRSTRSSAV